MRLLVWEKAAPRGKDYCKWLEQSYYIRFLPLNVWDYLSDNILETTPQKAKGY